MISTREIKENGIVGAGGAGFPAYVKLESKAEIFIVNAAECEPLLHKDKEILLLKTDFFFEGLKQCIRLVGAEKCIIGIKSKYDRVIRHLEGYCNNKINIFPLDDFYPAGDEITLIYETTGRVVEAGTLPITQNVIVHNVETIYNVGRQTPVVSKFITIGGDVKTPVSVEVPIGISFREVLALAQPNSDDFEVIIGGPMMGKIANSIDQPVTKVTGGLLVFPKGHILIKRIKTAGSEKTVTAIGKSACDQCSMCTELCPRNLLGHPIQPHKAMRALAFSHDRVETNMLSAHALFCCECNLCSLISCPEDLYPAQVCMAIKQALMSQNIAYSGGSLNTAHELIGFRRTPIKKIMAKLDLLKFKNKGPLVDYNWQAKHLKLMLRQHIGISAKPVIKTGEAVSANQKIATVGKNLGAEVHSPIDGKITEITKDYILIERN